MKTPYQETLDHAADERRWSIAAAAEDPAIADARRQIGDAAALVSASIDLAVEHIRDAGAAMRAGEWGAVRRHMEAASASCYTEEPDVDAALDLLEEAQQEGGAVGLAEARGWLQ
jgi:hypothetical protein